jgi:hypothetical protein
MNRTITATTTLSRKDNAAVNAYARQHQLSKPEAIRQLLSIALTSGTPTSPLTPSFPNRLTA